MDDDEYSPLRRKSPLRDIFARRGHFSLQHANPERSEIPENTLGADQVAARRFRRIRCCKWKRPHDTYTWVSATVTVTVLVLLVASLAYHLFFWTGKTKDHNETYQEVPFGFYNINALYVNDEDMGESLPPLSPLGAESSNDRVPVVDLEDVHDDFYDGRPSTKFLTHELTKVVRRYRRTLSRLSESHHDDNKLARVFCSGEECNKVDVNPRPMLRSSKEALKLKLDEILDSIKSLKAKLRTYEEKVRKFAIAPFQDFIVNPRPSQMHFNVNELDTMTDPLSMPITAEKLVELENYTNVYNSSNEDLDAFLDTESTMGTKASQATSVFATTTEVTSLLITGGNISFNDQNLTNIVTTVSVISEPTNSANFGSKNDSISSSETPNTVTSDSVVFETTFETDNSSNTDYEYGSMNETSKVTTESVIFEAVQIKNSTSLEFNGSTLFTQNLKDNMTSIITTTAQPENPANLAYNKSTSSNETPSTATSISVVFETTLEPDNSSISDYEYGSISETPKVTNKSVVFETVQIKSSTSSEFNGSTLFTQTSKDSMTSIITTTVEPENSANLAYNKSTYSNDTPSSDNSISVVFETTLEPDNSSISDYEYGSINETSEVTSKHHQTPSSSKTTESWIYETALLNNSSINHKVTSIITTTVSYEDTAEPENSANSAYNTSISFNETPVIVVVETTLEPDNSSISKYEHESINDTSKVTSKHHQTFSDSQTTESVIFETGYIKDFASLELNGSTSLPQTLKDNTASIITATAGPENSANSAYNKYTSFNETPITETSNSVISETTLEPSSISEYEDGSINETSKVTSKHHETLSSSSKTTESLIYETVQFTNSTSFEFNGSTSFTETSKDNMTSIFTITAQSEYDESNSFNDTSKVTLATTLQSVISTTESVTSEEERKLENSHVLTFNQSSSQPISLLNISSTVGYGIVDDLVISKDIASSSAQPLPTNSEVGQPESSSPDSYNFTIPSSNPVSNTYSSPNVPTTVSERASISMSNDTETSQRFTTSAVELDAYETIDSASTSHPPEFEELGSNSNGAIEADERSMESNIRTVTETTSRHTVSGYLQSTKETPETFQTVTAPEKWHVTETLEGLRNSEDTAKLTKIFSSTSGTTSAKLIKNNLSGFGNYKLGDNTTSLLPVTDSLPDVTNTKKETPDSSVTIPSLKHGDATSTDIPIDNRGLPGFGDNSFLENEVFAHVEDPKMATTSVPPRINDLVKGISLEEAKMRRNMYEQRTKWNKGRFFTNDEFKIPTGPDAPSSMGETSSSGQQISFSPSAYSPSSSMFMPYQVCFYGSPNHGSKGVHAGSTSRTVNLPFPMYPPFPGFKVATSTVAPLTGKPSPLQNVFNIVMNNFPTPVTAPGTLMTGPSHLASSEALVFPYQQPLARYPNTQHLPLFCSHLQAPFLLFPSVSGPSAYGHSKCKNCEENIDILQSRQEEDDIFEGPLMCPEGTTACKDKQLCIPSEQWCDGHAQCIDASDELFCSCRDRIMPNRLCDGYPDCPHGEDENDCFDCLPTEFSCGAGEGGACIHHSKQCDGNDDCAFGFDEEGCSLLTSSPFNITHPVSYSEGYLLKNWRGTWYPVCNEKGRQSWAEKACSESTGSDFGDIDVEIRGLPENVRGPFLMHQEDGSFVVRHHCKGHEAMYVRCNDLKCGTRVERKYDENEKTQFTNRFKRLVEHKDAPSPADRPFMMWWEQVIKDVQEKFNVTDVSARLEPIPVEEVSRLKREGTERVVGGQKSDPNSWPWAVALFRDGYFHCGGVVLDKEWILTAAHCVTGYSKHYYEVRVGMLRRKSYSIIEQIRQISNIVVHEHYDPNNMKNDLAVLRLAHPLTFGRWIRPICLPFQDNTSKGPVGPSPGSHCIAIGWGALKERGGDPDQLREVEVPIAASCKHREDIEGQEICAGYLEGGKDTCQGDSGGPLMCRDSSNIGAWYVAGIVSHGEGCARPDEPGAYTRVSLYVDWLADNTGESLPQDTPLSHCPGFKCHSHPGLCLPKHFHCNGRADCFGGEDEMDCKRYKFDYDEPIVGDLEVTSQLQMSRNDVMHDLVLFNYTSQSLINATFQCQTMFQRIQGSMRCDGNQDCEDASDEWNCTCRDHLLLNRPEAICNGNSDCFDSSDEQNCFDCPEDFFNCRRSHQCLILEKRCDSVADCTFKDDEINCLTLSNNYQLIIEQNGQSSYEPVGTLMENSRGTWRLACVNITTSSKNNYAKRVCRDLGLIGYEALIAYDLNGVRIDMKDNSNGFLSKNVIKEEPNCTALDVQCSEHTGNDYFGNKSWKAVIKVEGLEVCTGVLLNSEWILASSTCSIDMPLTKYVIAELGTSVYPPNFTRIDDVRFVSNSDIIILHLEHRVNQSRHIRPIQMPLYTKEEDLKNCQALFGSHQISLRVSDKNCVENHICFSRVKRPARGCIPSAWMGVVVCYTNIGGWAPVSVFEEKGGACGFQNSEFTHIMDHLNAINDAMGAPVNSLSVPPCNGTRCLEGRCISQEQVCNGKRECTFGDDESSSSCSLKAYTKDCRRDELRCANGKCIPRYQFADKVSQCGDGSDEPQNATCLSYLRLTQPSRICDGIRNCLDKTDEEPDNCHCNNLARKKCAGSNKCIPTEFICDGQKDCPSGDDEDQCVGLRRVPRTPNKYMFVQMAYGVWHSACGVNLTIGAADELCQRYSYKNVVSMKFQSIRPTFTKLDSFTSVRLNNFTKLHLRGDRPLITLRKEDRTCPGLFITCL